ncbi:hypothetical protein ZHAS_00013464 [Anopheles sinensis]|uniref:Uncharacterized protein n=1 Tax=Anopheles sinensis TaxID=74873 RepID=A0A084W5I1_ANOSI|nr:hypothetical protein ZHAS_00013464 [Anopheles sinensis]
MALTKHVITFSYTSTYIVDRFIGASVQINVTEKAAFGVSSQLFIVCAQMDLTVNNGLQASVNVMTFQHE